MHARHASAQQQWRVPFTGPPCYIMAYAQCVCTRPRQGCNLTTSTLENLTGQVIQPSSVLLSRSHAVLLKAHSADVTLANLQLSGDGTYCAVALAGSHIPGSSLKLHLLGCRCLHYAAGGLLVDGEGSAATLEVRGCQQMLGDTGRPEGNVLCCVIKVLTLTSRGWKAALGGWGRTWLRQQVASKQHCCMLYE
jgi:hypothetical protein